MYRPFLTFIKEQTLASAEDKILLGVSGGLDSMVLLDLFSKTEWVFAVAHVNYVLRGSDSEEDARFVEAACQEKKIRFHLRTVSREEYATGESVQMTARTIRYAFFSELCEAHGYTKIATAHHANDNLETVLFNLAKGTGISGLTGIASFRKGVIRPLLPFSRDDIRAYAEAAGIIWREDHSNAKNDYHRNRIRNLVVPELKKINPALEKTFQDTLLRLKGAAELVELRKETLLAKHSVWVGDELEIKTDWYHGGAADLCVLYEMLRKFGFGFSDIGDLSSMVIRQHTGATISSFSHVALVDRGKIIVAPGNDPDDLIFSVVAGVEELKTPGMVFRFTRLAGNEIGQVSDSVVFLDEELLRYPLVIRNWKQGDRFQPFGMTGHKKVSDFLIDKKTPRLHKTGVLVLESSGRIAWLINHRLDDRFKITSGTRRMLKIEVKFQ